MHSIENFLNACFPFRMRVSPIFLQNSIAKTNALERRFYDN